MIIAKLIDGSCKGQVANLTVDSFPDTVRAYEFNNQTMNFSAATPNSINIPIRVYHFKRLLNAGVAEYSIEVQKK